MGVLQDFRRWRLWRKLITHVFAAVGGIAVLVGLVDAFSPASLVGQTWVLWVGGIAAFGYGVGIAWPRPVSASFESPKTLIKVVRGDLFAQDAHLVIGTCDTFDTAFPHVAQNSVQGKFLDQVYRGDVETLDRDLNAALAVREPVTTISKAGKTTVYELGTVATIQAPGRRYFLVAYTSMDEKNKAHATADGLWRSLTNLWDEVRNESNGSPVAIAIIGGGQSGLSPMLPAEDSIRLIALSFMMASRKSRVCEELRIVALPAQYDKLDHLELQAFLNGLKRS